MAERKVTGSIFQGGKAYGPNSTEAELEELDNSLSPEDVERLEKDGTIEGFTGSRDPDADISRGLTAPSEIVRPTGVKKEPGNEERLEGFEPEPIPEPTTPVAPAPAPARAAKTASGGRKAAATPAGATGSTPAPTPWGASTPAAGTTPTQPDTGTVPTS